MFTSNIVKDSVRSGSLKVIAAVLMTSASSFVPFSIGGTVIGQALAICAPAGDGTAQIIVCDTSIPGAFSALGGADSVTVNAGVFGSNISGGAGGDTMTLNTGADINANLNGNGGSDIFLLNGGQVQNVVGGLEADTFNLNGSDVVINIAGGDGADIFNLTSGSVGNAVNGGEGNDVFNVLGNVATTLNGGDNADTFNVTTGTVSSINSDDGQDNVIVSAAGTVTGDIDGGDGIDTFTVNGLVGGDIIGGNGVDTFNINGGIIGALLGGSSADIFNLDGGTVASASGGIGADTFNLDGSTISGDLDGNGGADIFNLTSGFVTGDVLGGATGDTITLQGATIGGLIDGGGGGDEITVTSGMALGGIFGGAGADTFNLDGGTILNVRGGIADDEFNLDGATITQDLIGNGGADTFNLRSGLVSGEVQGGDEADEINIIGATVSGGVFGDNGADTIVMSGGTVGTGIFGGIGTDDIDVNAGIVSGEINGGAGIDTLDVLAAANVTGVTTFNGGAGNDVATFVGQNLQDKVFTSWDIVNITAVTILDLDGTPTIDTLNVNQSALTQADGALTIDPENAAFSIVNLTNGTIEMRDLAANDSITVGNLNLDTNSSVAVDFDAASETADRVIGTNSVTPTGSPNIALQVFNGTPTSLTGSVGIINEGVANDGVAPAVGDTLVPSAIYNVLGLPVDPAREFAIVNVGNEAFLQWTTPINELTLGPNVLASYANGQEISGLINSAAELVGNKPGSHCYGKGGRLWAQGLYGNNELDATDGFSGVDAMSGGFLIGVDAGFGDDECGTKRFGGFAFYNTSEIDINDGFDSDASSDTYGGGLYGSVKLGDVGFSVLGLVSKTETDLLNGVLLGAESDFDTYSFGGQIEANYSPKVGENTWLDFRVYGRAVEGEVQDYTDSFGLEFDDSRNRTSRVGATAGFVYDGKTSGGNGVNFFANAGVAFGNSNNTSTTSGFDITQDFSETLGTVDAGVSFNVSERTKLFAQGSGEWGENTRSYSGRVGLKISLN